MGAVPYWEPGGARLSACRQEKGRSIGALWASFAGKFLVVARAACSFKAVEGRRCQDLSSREVGKQPVCFLVVARLDAVAMLHRLTSRRSVSTGMEFRCPAGIVRALFWQRTSCSMRKGAAKVATQSFVDMHQLVLSPPPLI